MSEQIDTRWICWQCGDLAQLDDRGLCRECEVVQPSATYAELVGYAIHGWSEKLERVWWVR